MKDVKVEQRTHNLERPLTRSLDPCRIKPFCNQAIRHRLARIMEIMTNINVESSKTLHRNVTGIFEDDVLNFRILQTGYCAITERNNTVDLICSVKKLCTEADEAAVDAEERRGGLILLCDVIIDEQVQSCEVPEGWDIHKIIGKISNDMIIIKGGHNQIMSVSE